jgi:hypothetical protein
MHLLLSGLLNGSVIACNKNRFSLRERKIILSLLNFMSSLTCWDKEQRREVYKSFSRVFDF